MPTKMISFSLRCHQHGTDRTWPDTKWSVNFPPQKGLCKENEHAHEGECMRCPEGTTNVGGEYIFQQYAKCDMRMGDKVCLKGNVDSNSHCTVYL